MIVRVNMMTEILSDVVVEDESEMHLMKAIANSQSLKFAENFIEYKTVKGEQRFDRINTKMLSEYIISKYNVMISGEIVYHYQDGIYKIDEGEFVKMKIEGILGELGTKFIKAEVLAHVLHTERIHLDIDSRSLQNRYLIGFNNGVYNYSTGEFKPHSPEYFLTTKLHVSYDKKAKSEAAIQMMKNIFGDDLNDELEYMAYALTSTNWLDTMSFYIGDGKNGRTFYFGLLSGFFGSSITAAVEPHDLATDKFAGYNLVGKQINIIADMGEQPIPNFHKLKQFSTEDLVRVQDKGKTAFFARISTKHFLGGNKMPVIFDKSFGSIRRQRIVVLLRQFNSTDSDYDPYILERAKTKGEYSGLLNILLEHLSNLYNRGEFNTRDNAAEFSRKLGKSIPSFVEECISVSGSKEDKVLSSDVKKAYTNWSREMKFPTPNGDSFIEDFVSLLSNSGVAKKQIMYRGTRGTYVEGITLTQEGMDLINPHLNGEKD